MKRLKTSWWLAVLLLPIGCRCQNAGEGKPGGDLVRWHFAGRAALAQGSNATRLKQVDALPSTAKLRGQIAGNLSGVPRRFWDKELPAGTPDGAALLLPVFEDLLQAESYGLVRGPVGRLESALAIELSDDRARLWNTNLWQLIAAWKQGTPTALTENGTIGWEAKLAPGPGAFQLRRAGKWTVLTLGPSRTAPSWLGEIQRAGRPGSTPPAELVELELDSPALGRWFPLFTDLDLPPLKLRMFGRGENVRTEAKLHYARPLALKQEPWALPANLIGEPLSSFCAARGVAPLLSRLIDFGRLDIGPTPNQICLWGTTNDPCRIYFTFPVGDAVTAMHRLSLTAPRLIEKMIGEHMGEFLYATNRNTVVWASLPYIHPFLQPATNAAGKPLIHGGMFPLPPRQELVTNALYAEFVSRTNLLYYDWETTPYRIMHGNQVYQLLDIASKRMLQSTKSPSKVWLLEMARELARDPMNPSQTVTEIAQTGPDELTLTRKSHLGLTGFEIATLSAWLDSPGFPFHYERSKPMRLLQGTNGAAPPNLPGLPKRTN